MTTRTESGLPAGVEPLLTIAQLAEYVGSSRTTIYRRLADPAEGLGKLAIPWGQQQRFRKSEIDVWLDARRRRKRRSR